MRHIKIIELKAQLEAKQAKYAQLKALIREKQRVDHQRDREVRRSGCNASLDKHEGPDADNEDSFIPCAEKAYQICFACHSVRGISHADPDFCDPMPKNTSERAHDEPLGGQPNAKVRFFKSLDMHLSMSRSQSDEGIALMERFMRLQRLVSLLDSPEALMRRSSSLPDTSELHILADATAMNQDRELDSFPRCET
jgi:hypothetical protein